MHLPPMKTLLQRVKPVPKISVKKEIPLYFFYKVMIKYSLNIYLNVTIHENQKMKIFL